MMLMIVMTMLMMIMCSNLDYAIIPKQARQDVGLANRCKQDKDFAGGFITREGLSNICISWKSMIGLYKTL